MSAATERIVDVVFATVPPRRARGVWLGIFLGLGVHALPLLLARAGGPSLETWASEVSLRVHAQLMRTEAIELPQDPPASSPTPTPPIPAPPAGVRPRAVSVEAPREPPSHEHRRPTLHPAVEPVAAAAGQVLTAADEPAPADFTGQTFVVGNEAGYAGGSTRIDGKGAEVGSHAREAMTPEPAPVRPTSVPAASPASRAILVRTSGHCAWPREAAAEAADEEAVVVQITVDAAGRLEGATVTAEPGFGFGRAALECARAMTYSPALDPAGKPVRSSVSVRVRVWR